ncbi:hypothetical protein DAPPUDRAFT_263173 [Daphnia pulex]|uniref:Uncharacterized protein n=1 Tax=Daphnia pulex TaxID=6669 RepID=E9HP92_DAPPU|nr:hypothetical protein DAPPUDRAFT_263173 [Daphnia pulex]|eukprot:EFX66446.1 hypothetical protein DAPPUDRAFT_263173 [Daphnia pulex]
MADRFLKISFLPLNFPSNPSVGAWRCCVSTSGGYWLILDIAKYSSGVLSSPPVTSGLWLLLLLSDDVFLGFPPPGEDKVLPHFTT